MKVFKINQLIKCIVICTWMLLYGQGLFGQVEKKVMLQVFWWDYENDNYPDAWADYLTDLAPRLQSAGVDAIWIPPSVKNQDFGGIKGVGYAPFDHYDLGDKFQKADPATRFGTKDELLRMIAVMHANGIEVIQDIVPNHIIGAESTDPASTNDMYSNFRYSCYATPATDGSEADYISRAGRFPKNYQNFHANPAHNCSTGDLCSAFFGPDICYVDGAFGLSSNATYNPDQSTGHMRNGTRNWLIWCKKQMAFDGVRIDAVKHFDVAATEDFLYNLQHNSGFASGGDPMLAVGEWVGGKTELDAWTGNVLNRAGTFDFGLRAYDAGGGLYGMIYGGGGFDLGNLPGAQQNFRYLDLGGVRIHRTVPFINNHDTYRPNFDATGNIISWNTGSELSAHIDIREPRLAAAYAVMMAVDGNPQIFYEDLFNVANTSQRFSHLPTSTTNLPVNQDIANIMQAHGALNFKGGDYLVRSSEASHFNVLTSNTSDDDHIIIEREGQAIIGATDQWATDQESWVDSGFPAGTVLMDYSGGIATTSTVQGDNRVNIKTRGVGYPDYTYSTSYADHGAHYHGYSIWAPVGQSLVNNNPSIPTSQEWEMANDLGDSHCQSLTQGGALPANRTDYRIVGKVFVDAGNTISYSLTPEISGNNISIEFYDLNGTLLHQNSGTATIVGSFSSASIQWITTKIRYKKPDEGLACSIGDPLPTTPEQKVWVRLTYDAPATISTASYASESLVSFWTGAAMDSDWSNCRNWEEGLVPINTGVAATSSTVIIPPCPTTVPTVEANFPQENIDNRSNSDILPIELIYFDAHSLGTEVLLEWQTASEINNDYFEIERRLDGQSEWFTQGKIDGNGTSSILHEYSFIDDSPSNKNYYRLKQVDFDKQSTYSSIKYVEVPIQGIKIYPNPFYDELFIDYPIQDTKTIEIMDLYGRQWFYSSTIQNMIPVDHLPSGMYFLLIRDRFNVNVESISLIKN